MKWYTLVSVVLWLIDETSDDSFRSIGSWVTAKNLTRVVGIFVLVYDKCIYKMQAKS